jgi:hypothetical protein
MTAWWLQFMLDIMAPLISEADNVTVPELVEVVLDQIVEPQKVSLVETKLSILFLVVVLARVAKFMS